MSNPQDRIEIHKSGAISCVGKDAVNLYRAITLKQALAVYARTGMLLTRTVRPTGMLQLATEYTGKVYKRGQHQQAADDVQVWISTRKAAMPVVKEGEVQ